MIDEVEKDGTMSGDPASADLTFEASLLRLERIVRDLEAGEASLSDSMRLFEEGVRLARRCSELLSAAERKIELLVDNADGTYSLRPFEQQTSAPDKSARERND